VTDLVVVVLDQDLASLGGDDPAADRNVELFAGERLDPYVITLDTRKNDISNSTLDLFSLLFFFLAVQGSNFSRLYLIRRSSP
jgi:hypothetical protein